MRILVDVHGSEVHVTVDEPPAGDELAFEARPILGHLQERGYKYFKTIKFSFGCGRA